MYTKNAIFMYCTFLILLQRRIVTIHNQIVFLYKVYHFDWEEFLTTQKIRLVQNEGTRKVSREVTFYSLDAIIAVGYRINSKEATDFRIWATKTLKEYIKKGFVINSEMLKNGPKFGKDYFDELLVCTIVEDELGLL